MSLPADLKTGEPISKAYQFLYGRLRLDPDFACHLLDRDGCVGHKNEDGAVELIFFTYAKNVEEARELTKMLQAFSIELDALRADLDQFIDDFDFTKEEN